MTQIMDLMQLIQIIVIPVVVAVIALIWNQIQSWFRGKRFENLILREIEEAKPNKGLKEKTKWQDLLTKEFVHQDFFNKAVENRDFILSLNPDLVYNVSQLWKSKNYDDPYQWLWYLYNIAKNSQRSSIIDAWEEWLCVAIHYDSSTYLDNDKVRDLFGWWAALRYNYELKSTDKKLLMEFGKSADLKSYAGDLFSKFKQKFMIDSSVHKIDCKDT